jgi:hypothetical protein
VAQPVRFVITVDFSDEEAGGVAGRSTVRTAALDALMSAIKATLDDICDNLALIQRDDGELLDGRVKIHTLASDVLALISSGAFNVTGGWVTATEYEQGDIVLQNSIVYLCIVDHTSGTFATDLAAMKWGALTFVQSATDTPFSATSTLSSTNVQAAIQELDNEVRPVQTLLLREMFNAL